MQRTPALRMKWKCVLLLFIKGPDSASTCRSKELWT